MSNNYVFTYRFVTGEVTVISLCELVTHGKLSADSAVKFKATMVKMDDDYKKIERRETRRHSSLEKLIETFVPIEKIARHKPFTPEGIHDPSRDGSLYCVGRWSPASPKPSANGSLLIMVMGKPFVKLLRPRM